MRLGAVEFVGRGAVILQCQLAKLRRQSLSEAVSSADGTDRDTRTTIKMRATFYVNYIILCWAAALLLSRVAAAGGAATPPRRRLVGSHTLFFFKCNRHQPAPQNVGNNVTKYVLQCCIISTGLFRGSIPTNLLAAH